MADSPKHHLSNLLILSDLWGREKSEWMKYYYDILSHRFQITFLDICELGHVDKSVYTAKALHAQFVTGGIDTAVKEILELKDHYDAVLAFSMGGYIAWRAAMDGFEIKKLVAVSSTRLRLETERPVENTVLFYGAKDSNKPPKKWFKAMGIEPQLISNESHNFYREEKYVEMICEEVVGEQN